ncbi:Erg28-like protein, partial [Sistotremastrum suecicum HHB10207 ss-3]
LPPNPGLLPKWQLFVAATALGNTIQTFLTLSATRKVYNNNPGLVTPLSSRSFGVWTLTSAIVRFYCAYHITEKTIYDITMWTYVLALGHFTSELLIYRTAKLPGPVIGPFIVATLSLTWMFLQYDHYVSI